MATPSVRPNAPPSAPLSPTASALAEIRRHPPDRVLIAALDIGKDVNVLYLSTAAGLVRLPPTEVVTLASGFAHLTAHLDQHLASGACDLVILGHEPTGIYHEAWSAALLERYQAHLIGAAAPPLRYRLVVTNQVKQERQRTSHRHRKTDSIDVVAIARLLADGAGSAVPLLSPSEHQLRLTLGYLRRLAKQQLRLELDILRTLDRLWPGALGDGKRYARAHPALPPLLHLVDSRPLQRMRVRLLLEHCPNPYTLRERGPQGIRDFFHQHGQRCGTAIAQRICAVLDQSLLPPPCQSGILAQQVQQAFAVYRAYEQQIAELETTATTLLPATSGQVLTSVPGVSALLAARYLAAIGSVARFPSAAHIWSYAGYDPIISDSGNGHYHGPISHQGSPYLRATLFQLGYLVSLHNGASARLYVLARQRGLAETPACIHVAHALNQTFYALLTRQELYRAPLSAEAAAPWLARAQAYRQRRTVAPR